MQLIQLLHIVQEARIWQILDEAILGKCLQKWEAQNLKLALVEYQSFRLSVISVQILYSRRIGQIRQVLTLSNRDPLNLNVVTFTQFSRTSS